ncbi:hypothetical protein CMI39_02170 [Candidatus Pacearchaeota archaeon]|nr:hypothetical protein [Candidatus Pacearchaeota archaeon]
MKKFNFYAGGFAASNLLTILVILVELSSPFKEMLTSVFIHHWIGKFILITIGFIVFGFTYKKDRIFKKDIKKAAWYSVVGSLDIIFLFYLILYFI